MIQMRRITVIPDFMQIRVMAPQAAAAAVSWWLSGGISAANAIAVYQPKGAASLAASYINLANPGTYNAAPGVAPTWASGTGWTFNGSTQYLSTGLNQADNMTVLIRVSDWASGSCFGSRGNPRLFFTYFSALVMRYHWGENSLDATYRASGVYALAKNIAYYNGATDGTVSGTFDFSLFHPMYIGAFDRSNSADDFASAKIQALAIYDTPLTAPQVLAVSTAAALL